MENPNVIDVPKVFDAMFGKSRKQIVASVLAASAVERYRLRYNVMPLVEYCKAYSERFTEGINTDPNVEATFEEFQKMQELQKCTAIILAMTDLLKCGFGFNPIDLCD